MFRWASVRREWLAVWLWAACTAGVMLVPLARRYADERDDWRFTGIVSIYFDDAASHLSWVRQARDGYLLFEPKFAGADPRGRRMFNLLFLVMGWSARAAGLSVVTIYHVERTLAAILTLAAVYWFASLFFEDRRMRWVTLILVTTSAGLEWTLPAACRSGVPRLDLVQTNTFQFLATDVMIGPSTALMLLSMGLVHRAMMHGSLRRYAAVGASVLAQAVVHPQDVPTVVAVAGVLTVVLAATAPSGARARMLGRGVRTGGALILATAPVFAYHAWALFGGSAYAAYRSIANEYPPTSRWLMEFGVVLIFAVAGAAAVIWRRERHRALLVAWPLLVAAVLELAGPRTQIIHLYDGVHVVLCALATRGLWAAGRAIGGRKAVWGPRRARRLAALSLAQIALLASITNVLIYVNDLTSQDPEWPRYLRIGEREALGVLDAEADPDDVIACLGEVGIAVPLWTGSRVYVGDTDTTPDYEQRARLMESLMGRHGSPSPDEIADILRTSKADYIYIEPEAWRLGAAGLVRTLLAAGLAERVFENTDAAIYRVTPR